MLGHHDCRKKAEKKMIKCIILLLKNRTKIQTRQDTSHFVSFFSHIAKNIKKTVQNKVLARKFNYFSDFLEMRF